MNWHSEHDTRSDKRKVTGSAKTPPSLAKLLSSGRTLRDVELYQKIFPEKVNARIKDKISNEATDNPANDLGMHRKVVGELWEEDKDKAHVREAINATKKARQAEGKGERRTPEQYQKYVFYNSQTHAF